MTTPHSKTGVEQASPAVDEPEPRPQDPTAPLMTADGHVAGTTRRRTRRRGSGPCPPTAPAAAAEELAATVLSRARRAGRPDRRARGVGWRLDNPPLPRRPFLRRRTAGASAQDHSDGRRLLVPYRDARDAGPRERPVPVAAPTPAPQPVAAPEGSSPPPAPLLAKRRTAAPEPVSTAGGLAAQLELCSALQGLGALLDGPDDAAAPPRPDDAKLEGLVGDLIAR